ncbi:MAG: DUF4383 domain-containing protein [bacterium]
MTSQRFAKIAGIIALIIGVLGFFFTDWGWIQFDPLHNLIHVALGLWGILAGFNDRTEPARIYAKSAGLFYAVVFIIGLVTPSFLTISFEMSENILHFILSVWGLYAGFSKVSSPPSVIQI